MNQTIALAAARAAALVAALAAAALPTGAQQPQSRADRFMDDCDRGGHRDRERFCEVRDLKMPAGERLFVDARENGSVRFFGHDRNEILVRALVSTWADSRPDAQGLAKEISVQASGGRISVDGPSTRRSAGWAVSFEVWVPRRMDVEAVAHNGGVSVDGVSGRMDLRAVNGGVSLQNVGGDVRAETTNGSVRAALSGTTWAGNFLDLETTNGSVTLDIPRNYNAQLETGTVNGGMHIDFPVTVQGRINDRISTKLGNGGPRVRARTTNGSVRIREIR